MPSLARTSQGFGAWWEDREFERHTNLRHVVDHCENHYEGQRRSETLLHLAMYGDRYALASLPGVSAGRPAQRLKFNLTKSVIDTVQSEVAAMRPRATILTNRGNWGQKQRAQAMELMVAGEYADCKVYAQGAKGFLNAAKTGTAGFHIYQSGWRPKVELLPVGSILVDPIEARDGEPKSIYRVMLLPRYEVLGRWGTDDRKRAAIERQPKDDARHWFPWLPRESMVDHLLVIEATRAPDPEDWRNAGKGNHVIAIQSATLVDEEWERPNPYTFYRYDEEESDFFGRGIAANLLGLQSELNDTLIKIQDCIELSAGYRTWVEGGAEVNLEHIDNVPGTILRYVGAVPPQTEVMRTVPPELLEHAESCIRRGYEQEGVSMLSAMSRKPQGLDSGAAMREHNDIESRRFRIHSQAYEEWIAIETAERVIEEKRWIAKQPGSKAQPITAQVRRGRQTSLKTINWAGAGLESGSYQMQVYPSSSLPTQPSGRMAMVEQWMGAGLIDRETAMQLMDFPDVDAFSASELAPYEYVLWHCEVMLEDGEYMPPVSLQDPAQSMKLARQCVMRAEMDGAPEEVTELVYRYIDDLRAYEERAQQDAQAAQAAQAPQQPPAAMSPPAMAQA